VTFDCTALTVVGWVSGLHSACKECHSSISGDVLVGPPATQVNLEDVCVMTVYHHTLRGVVLCYSDQTDYFLQFLCTSSSASSFVTCSLFIMIAFCCDVAVNCCTLEDSVSLCRELDFEAVLQVCTENRSFIFVNVRKKISIIQAHHHRQKEKFWLGWGHG